ncbi:MAG: protein kinase [Gemmatimonadaceae bacterium]
MELRDQLESVLGSTYTIERELGGGGMSRVFAATEKALGRSVVIKVVPLELSAGVNLDRFKREILLAANLQHPHIVPVLTAGEIDGVPYYTMPFVAGESLRVRLERGALPISEAVGIMRDVAKALAYAHAHGVVHRDIKPDNVLMSGGSAAVADFGIAKALAAAGEDTSDASSTSTGGLTQIGMSIGTPIYMAPEQAAADPNADHRADIYSFGCLAYELLAGTPPFSGPPHKLLVAHMSERPRSVAELRAETPRALSDLVMRCLEKDPDLRPQSAGEIVRQLEEVTSTTSMEAIPAAVLARPGALRRALVVYVAAIAAMVVVSRAAIVGIGLPDWVLPASIVLLALGFPVIAAVAYFRQFSWRKTAGVGIAAVIAFVALIGGFMTLRASGVGPFGSLLGAGKLNQRDKILVADFTSTGSDTTLGGVVSEAVRADLGQSPIVQLVTPQTVAAVLQRMQLPASTRVDTSVARQLAKREGVKAIVSGDVHSLAGGGFVVTMRLASADSGQELASEQASADGAKDLIPTIGKLTRALRGKMGESLKHLQASPELAQVTTASLPALEKYSQGQRAMSTEGDFDKAVPLLREAIKLDTNFASAYRALAIALGNQGQDRTGQIAALEKAMAHSDRLPEVERFLTTAAYYSQGPKPDPDKAADAYQALLAVRPTNYAALNNLALIFAQKRDFAKAEEYLRRSIASNPAAIVAYGNLMGYQAELGQVAAMDSTFAAEVKASENNPRVVLGRVSILFARGDYDAAGALMDSLARTNPTATDLALQRLGVNEAIAMTRGKLNESLRLASQNAVLGRERGSPGALLGAAFDSAMVESWYRGNKVKGLARIQAGLARTPLSSLAPFDRPYESLAELYAISGRADLAKEAFAEFERTSSAMAPDELAATRHEFRGAIAFAEGKYLDAAHETIAGDIGPCTTCVLPIVATAYDLAGQPDSAIAAFTKYVESPSILNRFNNDEIFLAGSYKRLGELLESKGDRSKAVHYYTKFVELWKNADAELQPSVADVRKRLARLSDTEGKNK